MASHWDCGRGQKALRSGLHLSAIAQGFGGSRRVYVLVPNIVVKALCHLVLDQVSQKLIKEVVVVGPVPIVTRPVGVGVGEVGSPDVAREDGELGADLAGGLVVLLGRAEAGLATSRGLALL